MLTNYFNAHADQFIRNLMEANHPLVNEHKGSCRCCRALGRTISGCSCRGGKSHVCRKLKWVAKVRCKYCGAAGRIAAGCSCTKEKSHQ